MKPGITACIIARDEEKVIQRCLESLSEVDEIVVADTGSHDRTAKLAASWGAFVLRLEVETPFHFGHARQAALAAAKHEWVLSIDADEVLDEGGRAILDRLRKDPSKQAWEVGFLQRDTHDAAPVKHYLKRFFRADLHRWVLRVHEQAVPITKAEMGLERTIVLEHLPSRRRERRKSQNFELLKIAVKENPEYAHLFLYLAQEYGLRNDLGKALVAVDRYLSSGIDEGALWLSEARLFKGMILGRMKRIPEAIEMLERASQAATRREPLIHAAELERGRGRYGTALFYLDRALAIPKSAMPDFHGTWASAWGKIPHEMVAGLLSSIEKADAGFWGRIPAEEARRLRALASGPI
jgi:glycosyltransferase involved in cell wall biosynthesis